MSKVTIFQKIPRKNEPEGMDEERWKQDEKYLERMEQVEEYLVDEYLVEQVEKYLDRVERKGEESDDPDDVDLNPPFRTFVYYASFAFWLWSRHFSPTTSALHAAIDFVLNVAYSVGFLYEIFYEVSQVSRPVGEESRWLLLTIGYYAQLAFSSPLHYVVEAIFKFFLSLKLMRCRFFLTLLFFAAFLAVRLAVPCNPLTLEMYDLAPPTLVICLFLKSLCLILCNVPALVMLPMHSAYIAAMLGLTGETDPRQILPRRGFSLAFYVIQLVFAYLLAPKETMMYGITIFVIFMGIDFTISVFDETEKVEAQN